MKEDLKNIQNIDFSKLTEEEISEMLNMLNTVIESEEEKLLTFKIEE